ncbi:hypothetical protein ABLE93_05510 [Xanthobacter sp. KR7-65]
MRAALQPSGLLKVKRKRLPSTATSGQKVLADDVVRCMEEASHRPG